MGRGYLSLNTGYTQADNNDWEKLLNLEYIPKDIDGHYIAIRFKEDYLQVTNDLCGYYPVYYAQTEDYFIVSNKQQYISLLLTKKTENYFSLANLALITIPLYKSSYINEIKKMDDGSTLTIKKNKMILSHRELNYLIERDHDINNYWFSLKKSFELQLKENDFIILPFENTHSSRLALSIYCNKLKKEWGLLDLKTNGFTLQKYLHSNISNNLKIFTIPDLKKENEVWDLYTDYVLNTGLSDFPWFFSLAGKFKEEKGLHEINLLTKQAEWFFEKEPLRRIEKLYSIMKTKSFSKYKKLTILNNNLYRKDFYKFLLNDIEKNFFQTANSLLNTNTIYDRYYFFLDVFHLKLNVSGFAWLNDFRHFYSPGLLYSMNCKHLQQRLYNKHISSLSCDFYNNFSDEFQEFPKIKEVKNVLPNFPNQNHLYFPFIENKIGEMIESAEKIPYYDFTALLKVFKKAKNGNLQHIQTILKWVSFDLWRICNGF